VIPYIAQPRLTVAGHTFYAFGFLVAIALLAGWWMLVRRARRFGLDRVKVGRLTIHMLWWGYYGSHVLYLLLFQTADVARRPWRLLNPLDGIYSFGGIICGVLTVVWLARRYGFTRMQFWQYLDVAGFVFPFCWAIARTGCSLAHDHVGVASTSWIAVRFPTGPRLDLGLIEMLFTAGLAIGFLALDRWAWPAPFFFGLFFFVYGPFRLWLDTLQYSPSAPDRLFGWGLFALGCAVLLLAWRHRGDCRRTVCLPH
jgi:phosphatidylglycerol:prolipoprotein diacylglycerol transferase